MKLIKEIGVKQEAKRGYMWALFECPKCGNHIERRKHQGIVQEQCQDCFREYHRKTQIKHGDRCARLYRTWINMRARCFSKKDEKYHIYGGRGITICEEWGEYTVFKEWAITNGYTDSLTIDRIDVNGNYCPSNCQWITNYENSRKDTIKISYKQYKDIVALIETGEQVKEALTILGFKQTAYYNAKKRYKDIKE